MASHYTYGSDAEESFGSIGPPPSPPANQEGLDAYYEECEHWEKMRNRVVVDVSGGTIDGADNIALAVDFLISQAKKAPERRTFRFGAPLTYREDFEAGMTHFYKTSYKFVWPTDTGSKRKLTKNFKEKILVAFAQAVPDAFEELRADAKEELTSVKEAAKEKYHALKEKHRALKEEFHAAKETLDRELAAIPDTELNQYLSPTTRAVIKAGGTIKKTTLRVDGVCEVDGQQYGFSAENVPPSTPSPPRVLIERLPTTAKKELLPPPNKKLPPPTMPNKKLPPTTSKELESDSDSD